MFTWKYPGNNVMIAGDFTEWHPVQMIRKDFIWTYEIPLTYGIHRFKFVIDNNWVCDDSLPKEPDPDGNINNTIVVSPRSPMRKYRTM